MSREKAEKHGYRERTLGERKCRTCRFGGEPEGERGDETIYCRMFQFWAEARGVCGEWAPESR